MKEWSIFKEDMREMFFSIDPWTRVQEKKKKKQKKRRKRKRKEKKKGKRRKKRKRRKRKGRDEKEGFIYRRDLVAEGKN